MNAPLMIFLSWISLSSAETPRPPLATYQVPVPEYLASFSTYDLPNFQVEKIRGILKLSYPLPSALVGEYPTKTEIEGPYRARGPFTLQGKDTFAECSETPDWLECRVVYPGLMVHPRSVEQAVQEQFATPAERQARLRVARLFSGDPVGIIRIFRTPR